MRLVITIAERSLAWTFTDSERIDAWISSCPWWNGGGFILVRLCSPSAVDSTALALRRCIRGADDGAEVRVDELVATENGLAPAVADKIGFSSDLRELERIDLIAQKLAVHPRVFILWPGTSSLEETLELLERLQKHRDEPSPTFVLLDTKDHPLGGEECDLTTGWPVQPLLEEPGVPEKRLWPAYLHHRVAWETGGDTERAQSWDKGSLSALPTRDDSAFETWLNERARGSVKDFSIEAKKQAVSMLDRTLRLTTQESPLLETAPQLLREGLLWRPPGAAAVQPVPFVARALLLDGDEYITPLKPLLRSCLVCKPMAHEVLARCLELEARERTVVRAHGDLITPSIELERRWRHFENGAETSDRPFYPPGCPACPDDVWTFATFGEFLQAMKRNIHGTSHRHALRRLRNAVAHGRYVSWATLTMLKAAERELL